MRRDLWLSIHPSWVEKILTGEKTVELRRTRPSEVDGTAIIYSTAPVSSAVATAAIEKIVELDLDELWNTYGLQAAISKSEFDLYFAGQGSGTAIVLTAIAQLVGEIHFKEIVRTTGVKPAQGWRYLEPGLTASVLGLSTGSRA